MFTIKAYHNPYLRVGQHTMQAVVSVGVDAHLQLEPAPLALAIALDRSGSMEGTKIRAARNGAMKVVQALDAGMMFMIVAFNDQARVIFGPALGTSEARIGISAWGIGVDWDEKELRFMADATHGSADIIPTPNQIETAFSASFNEMRKTAIMNASMGLWTPGGVMIQGVQQVYPNIVPLGIEPDPTNPRQMLVSLGSFAAADQRDYLLKL